MITLPFKVAPSEKLKGIRGIVATRDIKEGEILEICPIIPIIETEIEPTTKTILNNYFFMWGEKQIACILGYGMLYNHDYNENVRFERDFSNFTMKFIAKRDIKEGEELYINYNQGETDPINDAYLQFDPALKNSYPE